MCSDIIEFQFLQVLMTLKSCLAIADILKATEKTVHTQLSDKSVTNQIILGLIVFFLSYFLHYMHLQIPLKMYQNALLAIFKLNDIYLYAMCFSLLNTFIKSKNVFFFPNLSYCLLKDLVSYSRCEMCARSRLKLRSKGIKILAFYTLLST